MKKTIFAALSLAVFATGLQSCSSEENLSTATVAPPTVQKTRVDTPEVAAFKKAWTDLIKQKNSATNKMADDAKQQQYKDDVTVAAKKFLLSNGVPESELQNNTAEDAALIRLRAYSLLAEKTKPTNN